MTKFVPDTKTRRWLVVAPSRAFRPHQLREVEDPKKVIHKQGFFFREDCPFCFGNEEMTPPEVYRWGKAYPQDPNWLVRVVPNKYPITEIHEVIIHSPDHCKDIADLPQSHVEILFKIFRERFRALSKFGQVLIFNNKGPASGESLIHPHSQVVVVPRQIKLDVLLLEPVQNKVLEDEIFVSYCPDFSQWPYEVWLAKKKCFETGHKAGCLFGELSDKEIYHLVIILQEMLRRLLKLYPHLSYNFYLSPAGCWYLRIIPRLTERAGFELGTGLHINVVEPKKAAKKLRAR